MKLEPGRKLEKNLKLLRSCSQVRIIQLTEDIDKLSKRQERIVSKNPQLRNMLTNLLKDKISREGSVEIENPQPKDLIGIDIPGYDPTVDTQPVKEYMGINRSVSGREKTLENYQTLHTLLSEDHVSLRKVKKFMNSPDNTRAFKKFATMMHDHSPILLSVAFKHQATELAERNGIANETFYSNAAKAFSLDETTISLGNDIRGRLVNAGKALVVSTALAAALIGGGLHYLASNTDKVVEGQSTPHASYTTEVPTPEQPVIAVSPKEDQTHLENNGPISINENINSYKEACEDFFQKTAEVYKFNTGKDIDLSGYGQSDIAINRNASVIKVEKDGIVYIISTQGHAAPNQTYLREAFEALGVEFTEESTKTTCIIDKYDSSKSIAITDSAGNPVRSGNVLVELPSGAAGYMYNPDMVRGGKQVLEAEGRDGSTLSEAECVAAYLLSDMYTTQDPDLSIALGETARLADTIKTTFYGDKDSYAIYLYSQDAIRFANSFNEKAKGITSTEQVQAEENFEHDER